MGHGRSRGWASIAALVAATAALALPSAGSAATWTEVASNTSENITAIEYQGPGRFWFTTSGGKIFKSVGGSFVQTLSAAGVSFADIEFQAGGQVGFAVGAPGSVYRSGNAGDSWTQIAGIVGGDSTMSNSCSGSEALGEVDSVRFAADTRAWITAGGSQIFRTVNGATAANVGDSAAGWEYINNNGGSCKIALDIDDVFPVSATNTVYFAADSFGDMFITTDALATPAALRPAEAGNGSDGARRLAGDPANPNRQWAVFPGFSGGLSYVQLTTDGWSSAASFALGEPGAFPNMYDVDFAGGTVLAVGAAGALAQSTDGQTFFFDNAPGALATHQWISVGAASATQAAAGGLGGKLVITDNANVIGDAGVGADATPPETTITKAPKKKVKAKKKKAKATFEFTSTEPGSTFACSLDGKPFAPCSSPFTVKVKKGKHGLEVVATDAAGNADATPAAYSWKVKKKKKTRRR